MSTETQAPPAQRTYGNWRRPVSAGLWGLSRNATAFLLVGFGLSIALMLFTGKLLVGLIMLSVVGITIGLLMWKDPSGRPMLATVTTTFGWFAAKRDGSNLLRQGPLTPVKTLKLPGILGTTMITEHKDRTERSYALLSYRTGHHTVVYECQPDGATNVDPEDIDQQVASFGEWLASHASTAGLEEATITVETAPDTGKKLARTIRSQIQADAPEVSRVIMEEIIKGYPQGAPSIRTFATTTFNEKARIGKAAKSRKPEARIEALANSLATELPHLTTSLRITGAGITTPMTESDLSLVARVAYDPAVSAAVEDILSSGEPAEDVQWDNAGPTATQAFWDYYQHDSGFTVTSVMSAPPRAVVNSGVLKRLLEPTPGIERKRVTLRYKPLPIDQATKAAERDHSAALFVHNAATKKTASLAKSVKASEQTAVEVASGAGLDDFTIIISATVMDEDKIQDAKDAVKILSATAQLSIRPCYGYQDAGMAMSLPFGFNPERHIKAPKLVKGLK